MGLLDHFVNINLTIHESHATTSKYLTRNSIESVPRNTVQYFNLSQARHNHLILLF